MKKILITIIIIGIAAFSIYQFFIKEKGTDFTLIEVVRGNVVQEVSETGQVKMGEEISLGFKSTGIIERIYVKVGDDVWLNTALVKINTTQLSIELNEARAFLEIAEAELNKLLAGSTPEEIRVAQTTLENTKQTLKDVEAKAEEDLKQAYEDALNVLDGSYENGSSALTTAKSVKETYFIGNDQESIIVKENEKNIEEALFEAKEYIDNAKVLPTNENIDSALANLKMGLDNIYNALGVIRNIIETPNYQNIVTAADKVSLDTKKISVNTGLTGTINAQQAIASAKLTNKSDINTAKGNVKKAQDELLLKRAGPRQVDIDLYQAKVQQARAKVSLLENQIWEATLRSPVKGKITKVNKEAGETAKAAESLVSLLADSPYEIKVDIYEEDIVKMEVGNHVEIILIAFPDETFKGQVVSINPAEDLVEGVVYYEATINFKETPEGIKPGMTADLIIRTALKENVLVIPEDAVQNKEGRNMVQVFKNKQIEERIIEIGFLGSDDLLEVISGLTEGENVVIE